jgi:deazaflavin-dependent oxidoreductase (nitroreductase family)
MTLARVARLFTRPRWLVTRFTRFQAWALRRAGGRIRRSRLLAGGQPVLSLTTAGRRSGRARSTVVAYLREGDTYFVTAGNLGSDRSPAWSLNLEADPRAEVEVGGERFSVRARRLDGVEAERVWRRLIERVPAVEAFRRLPRREIPVIALERERRPPP